MDILIFTETLGQQDALLYIGNCALPGPGYILTDDEHEQVRKIMESVLERREAARNSGN
jgi:hypothetical protein